MAIREFFSDWCEWKATRRRFLTQSGLAASSIVALAGSRARADDSSACAPTDIKASQDMIGIPASQVFSWVHCLSDAPVATLALYIAMQQTADQYVERVVLTDDGLETLAIRYFTPMVRNSRGYLPYMIFDQIVLPQGNLFLYARVIQGKNALVYRYTLTTAQLQRSQFNTNAVPQSITNILAKPFSGLISSPLNNSKSLFEPTNCLPANLQLDTCFNEHRATASFSKLGPGDNFELQVSFLHPEEATHYMRFFFVCDPVGRIVGMKKRIPNEAPKNATVITQLSSKDTALWGVHSELIGHIGDCPYVLLFWEDGKHAFREQILWLR